MNASSPPQRVRVTGPPRRRTSATSRARDLDAGTRLGGIYLGSLLREQLWLAVRVLALLGLTVVTLPLLFHLWPGLAAREVAGLPLGWLLPGVAVYPLLWLLGWWYVRRAERNERAFRELMDEMDR